MSAPTASPPRVSVVTATWNWSAALRCAMRSVLAQTFDDLELLVVGDGCSDDTAEVVAALAAADRRVRWIALPERSGTQVVPNNTGVAAARGELVAYLGHDDLWHPEHLESAVATLDAEGADLVYSIVLLLGPPESGRRAISGLATAGGAPPRFVPPSAWLHRRELLARVGGWRDHRELRLPHDCELLARIAQSGARLAASGRLTVFKFPASWRRDVYRHRDAGEQEQLLARLLSAPQDVDRLVERELLATIVAARDGELVDTESPGEEAPGASVERARIFKGAGAPLTAAQRVAILDFRFDAPLSPLEWHPVEHHPRYGAFRWSGPATRSGLHLPLVTDRDLDIEIQLLTPLAGDVMRSLRLRVEEQEIPLVLRRRLDGRWRARGRITADRLAGAEGPVRLELAVARTVRPADVIPGSDDHRALGLPFLRLRVRPAR